LSKSPYRDPAEEPTDESPSNEPADHLSQINTVWSMVARAHADQGGDATPELTREARAWIWSKYQLAIRKYLQRAIHDQNEVDDLFQEFGYRILKGDFRAANPERGKFRYYLKTALQRLVADHHRRNRRDAVRKAPAPPELIDDRDAAPEADVQFLENWRADLLQGTWQRLHDHEKATRRFHFSVLQMKARSDGEPSERLAERFGEELGRPVSAGWFNKQVWEARKLIAGFLLEDVARTLWKPTTDAIEEELIALGLHDFPSVKDALGELRSKSDAPAPIGKPSRAPNP
jgi:DNA-directed RNA polymerase specialized sigma24 family protein